MRGLIVLGLRGELSAIMKLERATLGVKRVERKCRLKTIDYND